MKKFIIAVILLVFTGVLEARNCKLNPRHQTDATISLVCLTAERNEMEIIKLKLLREQNESLRLIKEALQIIAKKGY